MPWRYIHEATNNNSMTLNNYTCKEAKKVNNITERNEGPGTRNGCRDYIKLYEMITRWNLTFVINSLTSLHGLTSGTTIWQSHSKMMRISMHITITRSLTPIPLHISKLHPQAWLQLNSISRLFIPCPLTWITRGMLSKWQPTSPRPMSGSIQWPTSSLWIR